MKRDDVKRRQAHELYVQGLNYTEIGKRMGFSRQHAQQLVRPPARIFDAVKRRAQGKCENCRIPVTAGHIHHMKVASPTIENFNDKRRLRYLCPSCHMIAHGGGFGFGNKGPHARNKRLSAERRQEIARNAARERWRRVATVTPASTDETPTPRKCTRQSYQMSI